VQDPSRWRYNLLLWAFVKQVGQAKTEQDIQGQGTDRIQDIDYLFGYPAAYHLAIRVKTINTFDVHGSTVSANNHGLESSMF
jgi:hypothetical protein